MSAAAPLAFLLPLAAPAFAAGDDDPISPDRPNFVNSPDVVGDGRWQIETGLTLDRDHGDGVSSRTFTTPLLLRRGVGDAFELRLATDGRVWQRMRADGQTDRASGWANLAPGFKWRLAIGDAEAGLPAMALLGQAELGTGSSEVADRHSRPALFYALQWSLPGDLQLGVMPGVTREIDDLGRHYLSGSLGVTTGFVVAGDLSGFVEVAASQLAAKRHGGDDAFADGGLTWRTDSDTQWDVELFRGISHAASDWTAGFGWSHRF